MKTSFVSLAIFLSLASSLSATVTVSKPGSNATVTSPVQFAASATAPTCAQGVASIGIYVNGKLTSVVNGATLNTSIVLAPGTEHTVVQAWDHCGGSTSTAITLTVAPAKPAATISAVSSTITSGSSSTLTVTANNATTVVVSGSDGSSYTLAATGGTATVKPTQNTTYTVKASNASSSASAAATVTVIPAADLQKISHVIFMLQENHSFDNYFGMLNPYRKQNGFNVSEDGVTYTVDGIDDKLATISNLDRQGKAHKLFKFKTTCIDDQDPWWPQSYLAVNTHDFLNTRPILMDGFVRNAETSTLTGDRSMGYYDQSYLNYYYYMASQFALSDRWFAPVASKTVVNRIATFTGGTTQGLVNGPGDDHLPQLNIPTIFQELDNAAVSWKIYYTVTEGYCLGDDECGSSPHDRYPATSFSALAYSYRYLYSKPTGAACKAPTVASSAVGDDTNSFCIDTAHIVPLSTYYSDLKNNTLPSFAFIEAGFAHNDEHPGPGQEIFEGQAQVAQVINSFMDSPAWSNSVFFLSYDEGGGAYDHVPPVPGHSNDFTDASMGTIPNISTIAVNPDINPKYYPCVPPGGVPTTHCDLVSNEPGARPEDAPAMQGFGAQLGFRLPNFVVSPFTRKHYVSHIPMDHTAVIKFVENRFIGASTHLTARDAAQPNLLDFFDFTNTPWATPPTPPNPVTDATLGYGTCTPNSL